MIYRADWLLPPEGDPLPGGWLRVEGEWVAAVGSGSPPPGETVRELAGCVLMPGLINAHCHLELTGLEKRLPPGKPFPVWVEELRAFTAALEFSDYRASVRRGIDLLLRGGATLVVDVGNTGAALPELAKSPLRALALVETLGLDPALASSRLAQAEALAKKCLDTPRFRAGLAPHAAYSCSPGLLSAILARQREKKLPGTMHLSESPEEADLFARAAGPLQEYCRRIFPGAPEHRGTTPVRWLESRGLLPERALLVHGNHLDPVDLDLLARSAACVVHCPSSHAFFGHRPFPYPELRKHGIPVCLGTDSLASGDSLSMLDQIRLFRKNFPALPAEEALRMATLTAARALRMENEIGALLPGRKADFIAVRAPGNGNPREAVLRPEAEVALSVIGGLAAYRHSQLQF